MKRILVVIISVAILCSFYALAETRSREEIEAQIAELEAELSALDEEESSNSNNTPSAEFVPLEKGSKGDDVKKLQQRLIELKYLDGTADGDFGNKTKTAIEMFQKDAGLDVTGVADEETLKRIYADDAPKAKVYKTLKYKDVLRDPNTYTGEYFKFSGKVFQLVGEEEYGDYIYTVLFIAADNNYDKICNVAYYRPKNSPRILEDDKVTVYAVCNGLYTYETVRGNSNTILDFTADNITN